MRCQPRPARNLLPTLSLSRSDAKSGLPIFVTLNDVDSGDYVTKASLIGGYRRYNFLLQNPAKTSAFGATIVETNLWYDGVAFPQRAS